MWGRAYFTIYGSDITLHEVRNFRKFHEIFLNLQNYKTSKIFEITLSSRNFVHSFVSYCFLFLFFFTERFGEFTVREGDLRFRDDISWVGQRWRWNDHCGGGPTCLHEMVEKSTSCLWRNFTKVGTLVMQTFSKVITIIL